MVPIVAIFPVAGECPLATITHRVPGAGDNSEDDLPSDWKPMTESNCLLSRQPIYGPKMDVAAYELRSNYVNDEGSANLDHDQLRTVFKMFTDTGLDLVVGESQGLVTLTPEALSEGLWKTIPKSRVTIGYLEPFQPEDEAAKLLSEVAAAGYRLALSGKLPNECMSMLGKDHTVILDVTAYTPEGLQERIDTLRAHQSRITATHVDTHDDLEYCKSLEFDFYQGHFLFKPAAQRTSIPVNRMNMIRLLSKLQDPKIPMPEIEKLVSQDVALSFKILRYANSAAAGLQREVNSAGHAVRLIGMKTVKEWSSALLLSSVDDKPRELMTSALVRAKMCELLGGSLENAKEESFLSAGLFSVLDALLDCPMEKAIAELPLADEIKAALVKGDGPIGQAIRCSIAYERADWDSVRFYGQHSSSIRAKYMSAIEWARKLNSNLLN